MIVGGASEPTGALVRSRGQLLRIWRRWWIASMERRLTGRARTTGLSVWARTQPLTAATTYWLNSDSTQSRDRGSHVRLQVEPIELPERVKLCTVAVLSPKRMILFPSGTARMRVPPHCFSISGRPSSQKRRSAFKLNKRATLVASSQARGLSRTG